MLGKTKNGCCSWRRPHSPRAVGVRDKFHEKGQWSLVLRKEKYKEEQRGEGQPTTAGDVACLKDCMEW